MIRSLDKSSSYAPRPRPTGTARRVEAFAQRSPNRPDPQCCDQQHGCNTATLHRRPLPSWQLSVDKENGARFSKERFPCNYSTERCRLVLVRRLPFYVVLPLYRYHGGLCPSPNHSFLQHRGSSTVSWSICRPSCARTAEYCRWSTSNSAPRPGSSVCIRLTL